MFFFSLQIATADTNNLLHSGESSMGPSIVMAAIIISNRVGLLM